MTSRYKTVVNAIRVAMLLCLACLPCRAGVNLFFNLADFQVTPATNRQVYVSSYTTPTYNNGSTIISANNPFTTDTNGQFTITNASLNLLYLVNVIAPSTGGQATRFKVWTSPYLIGTNTTYNGGLLQVADSTSTFPAGLTAWSVSTSDNRYPSIAGTNISLSTNNGVVTINSVPTIGGQMLQGVGSPSASPTFVNLPAIYINRTTGAFYWWNTNNNTWN